MNTNEIKNRELLRTEAEALVGSISPEEQTSKPAEILMHELLVHKVELEMQNEELRRAHTAMEEARDRYVELYEFSPVGYITINRKGMISEINLTASTLLGVDRTKLINRRFAKFIAPQDSDQWYSKFLSIMEHAQNDKYAFGLNMTRADGSTFYAHIDCLRREVAGGTPVLRLALSDVRVKTDSQDGGA
jgi:PAS domain S-box-containing protein